MRLKNSAELSKIRGDSARADAGKSFVVHYELVKGKQRKAGGRADSEIAPASVSIEDCAQRFDEALDSMVRLGKRMDDCGSYMDSVRGDDRSSEGHELEAERLLKDAEREEDPEVKHELLEQATVHEGEVGMDARFDDLLDKMHSLDARIRQSGKDCM